MGRCGRREKNNDHDNFSLLFNLEEHFYLNERLHMSPVSTNGNNDTAFDNDILDEVSHKKLFKIALFE